MRAGSPRSLGTRSQAGRREPVDGAIRHELARVVEDLPDLERADLAPRLQQAHPTTMMREPRTGNTRTCVGLLGVRSRRRLTPPVRDAGAREIPSKYADCTWCAYC
jgi:hypothetical protein